MGIFSKKIKGENSQTMSIQVLDAFTPTFSAFGRDFLKNETFNICVRTNASYASKLKVCSVRETEDGRIEDYPELDYLLQVRPNPTMNAATFWERVRSFYDIYNNSFIYTQRDQKNEIVALWSIDPSSAQCMQSKINKEWFIKFVIEGEPIIASYSDIIHLSRNVISSEMWGDDNKSILQTLELINTNYQGIENAIKTSAVIRFIGQVSTKLGDGQLKKLARNFTKNYLNLEKNDPLGIALVDSMITNIKEIDTSKQKTANYMEQTAFDAKIHRFLGCPEKICAGSANEDEVVAYIELTHVPFMIKVEQEMTAKVFSKREYGYKNRIKVNYNRYDNMSTKTKLALISATRELGFVTLGFYGDLLGIPVPKDRRHEILTSQNYYQSEKNNKKGENDGDGSEELTGT